MKVMAFADIKDLVVPPPEAAPVLQTKAQKLERLATLVENVEGQLTLFHNLEYQTPQWKANVHPLAGSAFAVAVEDATFNAAGLTDHSIAGVQKFFELSDEELHEFSCDCGGEITNKDQAARIRDIAMGRNQRGMPRFFWR